MLTSNQSYGYQIIRQLLNARGHEPFAFQEQTWDYMQQGESGLVNAPTGCGKTFSVFLGTIIRFINDHPENYRQLKNNGLLLLWITPLRALAADISRAMKSVFDELGLPWQTGIRNGDTSTAERTKQKKQMPEVLIITPESLHLLLAQKDYPSLFSNLQTIAVDEWHELLGSKRGVQVELALSRIVSLNSKVKSQKSESENSKNQNPNSKLSKLEVLSKPDQVNTEYFVHSVPNSVSSVVKKNILKTTSIWGISATIGNLDEAKEVLLSPLAQQGVIVKANMSKRTELLSIIPDEIEKFPWAGHLGIKLAHQVIPIIMQSRTTLIFINTRGMSETWYQTLLDICPDLAGQIALHHGSIDRELREWIEENLHAGKLKAVVCTASLDLGVDFRPVETVIQVGSPKGVARFMQRAGRSGHQPDAVSKIYFLPTHSLELTEAAALKNAMQLDIIESRPPRVLCYDVLIQYLNTLAVSDGFIPADVLPEIRSTFCYRDMPDAEWERLMYFITEGGDALQQYDDYKKFDITGGHYKILSRKLAMRHRMHIGTIVSDAMLKVRFVSGGYIGVIEEYFISRLEPGDVFTLAGRNLEFVLIKEMTVLVRPSKAKKSIVPSWNGGRMPLSANLGKLLRETLNRALTPDSPELKALQPLFSLQAELSHVPSANELLIEQIETKDGFHLFVYPFEGRLVHEAMAAILAYRISRIRPISFSFAMNDYGFELLSDQPIPVDDTNVYELFTPDNLIADIQRSVNSTEMARRKFRDVAVIGGLIFQGMPGEKKKARHLQSSASLLFNVFSEYDPENILMRQAYQEVMDQQMEEVRLRDMLERIQESKIVLEFPGQLTPFCFPIKVDSMREDLSSEKLEDRIKKMTEGFTTKGTKEIHKGH
ncbi:MAG: ligase-associated DNA damage response DEXH box helicase [Chitinophagaceae bacterium]|nr:ligase-associated DNA damage response DEXH box helicase [Chitinophagaceae bacterium]